MSRVKRGKMHLKKRKSILKRAKGYRLLRKKVVRQAATAIKHAGVDAYRGRKEEKRNRRALWQIKINAAARAQGLTYSQFMNKLKKTKIELDRKILATLAEQQPAIFQKIVAKIK